MQEDRLREETDLFIRNALRDGILSGSEADSLQRLTQYSAGDGVTLTVLSGIIHDIDSLYDASMKNVNTYYERDLAYYRVSGMLPSILEIPEEYMSPRDRRARLDWEAERRVKTSMARTFESERPSTLVEYIICLLACKKFVDFSDKLGELGNEFNNTFGDNSYTEVLAVIASLLYCVCNIVGDGGKRHLLGSHFFTYKANVGLSLKCALKGYVRSAAAHNLDEVPVLLG